jgi:hypothetical protein
MKCPNCGQEHPDGAIFCDMCGTPLAGGAAPGGAPPTVAAGGMPYPPAAPPPFAPAAPAPFAPAGPSTCPNCQAPVTPGTLFCETCGFSLQGAAQAMPPAPPAAGPFAPPVVPPGPAAPAYAPPPVVPPYVPATPATPPVVPMAPAAAMAAPAAQLVLPTGQQLPLQGRAEYVIGRQDPQSGNFPEVDLEPCGGRENGVSRRHARIFYQGGFFLEDLQSVNFTHLNKQKLLPRQPMPLNNGDEIMLGKLAIRFYTS